MQARPANTGTDPIGRVQVRATAAKTWTANFDDIRLDTTRGPPGSDTFDVARTASSIGPRRGAGQEGSR